MSTDESIIIPFPVNKLKAETLRLMAKDLGVAAGGKKDELLERLRASSVSGWVAPTKRKSDPGTFESPPTTTKKSRIPRTPLNNASATVVEPSDPPRRYSRRNRGAAAAEVSPRKNQEHPRENNASRQEDLPEGENLRDLTKPSVFDDYFTSGFTSVFITGDDLLTMVDEVPAPGALILWKVTSRPAERDTSPLARADYWLIPANEDDKVQNLTAFKEAYNEVFEKLRELKTAAPVSKKTLDSGGDKDGAMKPTKRRWYEVSVSRDLGNGALAVKLIKGTVKGKGIVPIKGAKEEDGTFWLSRLIAAKQHDSELLDQSLRLLT